ncbi:MAG TPA: GNAT family protein [Dehalococcoidia bacterium]
MIRGTSVQLRPLDPSDLEACLRWVNDPEVTRTLAVRYPFSRLQEQEWLETAARLDPRAGHLTFAIETLDGRPIGSCGIHRVEWENRVCEIGIMIGEKDCWDQGYGTDAVRTLVRFIFWEMNLNRVELQVFDSNPRAQASYRKCGFVEEGRKRQAVFKGGRYHDVIIMGLLREEFQAPEAAP